MDTIDERINNSLVLIIDRDKVGEFASIIFSLSRDYSLTVCGYPIDGIIPPEPTVHGWETEKELADIIRSLCPDHRIVCLVHHKHLNAQR